MKFWKLGLVGMLVSVSLSVHAVANTSFSPAKDTEGNVLTKTEQTLADQAAWEEVKSGLQTLNDSMNKLAADYSIGEISMDVESFQGVSIDDAKKIKGIITAQVPRFLADIAKQQTVTYTPEGGTAVTLFPGKNLSFTIRHTPDSKNPVPSIEPNGGSLGAFFINIDTTSTIEMGDFLDSSELIDIWYGYLSDFDIFQSNPNHPDPRIEETDTLPAYNSLFPKFSLDILRDDAVHELAVDMATSGSNTPNIAIENVLAYNRISDQLNRLFEVYQSALKWDSDTGRDALLKEDETYESRFKAGLTPILDGLSSDASTATPTLVKIENYTDTWEKYRELLASYFPIPPVSNGGILAGPPHTGESGYSYVITKFIPKYVNGAISFLMGFGVLFLIVGGITYLISSGDQELTKKAKDIIMWSVIACVLASLSWMFVHFIVSINFSPV